MSTDPQDLRAEQGERWQRVAPGWGRRASRAFEWSEPVSCWMVEQLALRPGMRVLELAAGPGDTGFLAAQAIAPGTLLSSDSSEAMLDLARQRARERGLENVEFARLELEWIDLPAASVDAALCRWGLMLCVDPATAAAEIRRVLKPGGRLAVAVWDVAERNPWATVDWQALRELSYYSPPDPGGPGMFALAPAARLRELLEGAGFTEVEVDGIDLDRAYESLEEFLAETLDLSATFADVWNGLTDHQRTTARERIGELTQPYKSREGLRLPGRTLVAAATA